MAHPSLSRAGRVALIVGLGLGAAAPSPVAASGWSLDPGGRLDFGFDSFAQVYRLTDFVDDSLAGSLRDTTDVFTERRVALEVGLLATRPGWTADTRLRLSDGSESRRGEWIADLGYRGDIARFDLDLEIERRTFEDDTDFSLSSDVTEARASAHWRREVAEDWQLGLRSRGEWLRYERRSPYELDSQRLDFAVTSELRRGLDQWFDVELGVGRRDVPDSNAIAYDRVFGGLEYTRSLGSRWQLSVWHTMERREYDDPTQRSPFFDVTLDPRLSLRLDERWEMRWNSSLEWVDFDEANEVYYDMFLGRTGFELVHRRGWLELGLEPRWSWLRSPVPVEDEYHQPSTVLRADWFVPGRLTFSVSEEIGYRLHRTEEPGALDLYSDFWFLRTTVLTTLRLTDRWSVDGFLSDEPEAHRRDADDARLTLFHLNVRCRF